MIFHVWLAFRRRTHPKFLGSKSVPFIELTRSHIDLQSVEPDMVRGKLAGVLQQELSQTLILIIGMNVQVVDEIIAYCHECNRAIITFDNEDSILLKHMVAEVILVFVKEVTLEALKFREGFLARNSPQDRYRIEILRTVITDDKVFRHRQN